MSHKKCVYFDHQVNDIMSYHLMLFWLRQVDESLLLHLVPESLGDDRVGQLDVGGHARRLARRQSHGLDLGEQEARI